MLKLLFEVDDLCRENNIQYMLFAGAQLGLSRHGGLIPWDDDIDIIMTLDNFDRFLGVSGTGLPPGRTVNALEKSTDYLFTYGRYVDLTTTALQRHTVFGGADPGVKIDVFCAVPTSEDLALANEHRLRILAFSEVVTDCAVMKFRREDEVFPFYEEEKKLYEELGRKEYITRRLQELKYLYDVPGSKPARYVLFSGMLSNSYLFDADRMEAVQDSAAFGHPVMAARDDEYFNELLYGESWYQVPANYQKPHHSWGVVLTQPYTRFLGPLRERLDLPAIRKTLVARKAYLLEQQARYKDCYIEKSAIKNLAAGLSAGHTVEDAVHAGGGQIDYKSLYHKLAPFYTAQLGSDTVWDQLAVPVSSSTATIAAECLLRRGDYPKARKVIALQHLHGQMDASTADRLTQQADCCKALMRAVYLDTPQNSRGLAERIGHIMQAGSGANAFPFYEDPVLGAAPDTALTAEAGGRLLLYRSKETAVSTEKEALLQKLLQYADDAISRYGDIGELWALKALALRELCGAGKAFEESLRTAVSYTVNGFVLQELISLGADIYAPAPSSGVQWDGDDLLVRILQCANRQEDLPLFPGKTISGAVYAPDGSFLDTMSLPESSRIELLVPAGKCGMLADLLRSELPAYEVSLRKNKSGRFITVSDPCRLGTTVNAVVNNQTKLLPYRITIRATEAGLAAKGSIAYKNARLDLPADEAAWLSAIGADGRPVGKAAAAFPIYAHNVTVEEYLAAAREEGLLENEKTMHYNEYLERRKNDWVKPTKVFNSLYNEILNVCKVTESNKS